MLVTKEHFVAVRTVTGVTVVESDTSLNTWTRKDGGFTVRVHNSHTVRFHRTLDPKVISRSL